MSDKISFNFSNPNRHEPGGKEYFADYNAHVQKLKQGEEERDTATRVLIPGRYWQESDPMPDALRKLILLADENGWKIQEGYAQSFHPAKAINQRDKFVDTVWFDAVKSTRRISISYNNAPGKFTCSRRVVDGNSIGVSDARFKEEIKK